jgi:serine phosphatase RsbU (regulator of sigma subunit)
VRQAFGGGDFLTGQIAELDTESGRLSWVNAGHLDPLLLRSGHLVKPLQAEPILPLGLGDLMEMSASVQLGSETLEPSDIVLFYSDGVVEARSPSGDFFGTDRLVDLVVRNLAAGLPAPETMRRVIHALLDHQEGALDDDATLLFAQYQPPTHSAVLP